MTFPQISFGIIVLNGEPFTRYCLRALYPFAHEIIVVEGAAPGSIHNATPEGHSTDGTLDILYRFKADEDPDNKIQIITRDGFWTEKDEMSQAYATRATGDYLWQVDVDEFYKPEDIQSVIEMLRNDPSITAVSFKMLTFWGSPDYITDGWILRRGEAIYHRLFKWGLGYQYVTHRPPTVQDADGKNLQKVNWISGNMLARKNILMYHYSLLFPKQVREKSDYYEQGIGKGYSGGPQWADQCYMKLRKPFRVHNVYVYPSWLERYVGSHPPQIKALWDDILAGKTQAELRQTSDIEQLLNSSSYIFQRRLVMLLDYVDRLRWLPIKAMRQAKRVITGWSAIALLRKKASRVYDTPPNHR